MLTNVKKKTEGFTIIEVMIVLVIAAVIILIVFLAVPALQRNSRNTQRKNDAAAILAAVNEWSTNNSGELPDIAAEQTAALANAQLGIYAGEAGWGTTLPASPSVTGLANDIFIAINNTCNGETALTAQNRSVAVSYRVETGGSATGMAQCESS